MSTISRRKFFKKTAAAFAALLAAGVRGIDAYPVRTAIGVPYLRDLKV
jgi:hypothetical protein